MGFTEKDLEILQSNLGIVAPKRKRSIRSIAGRVAGKNGAWWERQVDAECDDLRAEHMALVLKTSPPTRVVRGRAGVQKVIFEAPGPPDYVGFIATGKPVAFEAKYVAGGSTFGVKRPTIKSRGNSHQFDIMCEMVTIYQDSFVGYYLYWGQYEEKRFHPLTAFVNLRTTRLKGVIVSRWYDAIV
jgi:hypothetical protein